MFIHAARWSIKNEDVANKHAAQAMELFMSAGAESVSRFTIIDGLYEGQQMFVARFKDQATYEHAWREHIEHSRQRHDWLTEMQAAENELQEVIRMDELMAGHVAKAVAAS